MSTASSFFLHPHPRMLRARFARFFFLNIEGVNSLVANFINNKQFYP